MDSICDIVGACLALSLLGVERIVCSPLNTGFGTVATEHGVLPVVPPVNSEIVEMTRVAELHLSLRKPRTMAD